VVKSKNFNKDNQLRITLVQNLLFQIFAGSKYSHDKVPLNLLRPFMNVLMLLFQRRLVVSTVQWVPKKNEYQLVTCSVVDHTLHFAYKIKNQIGDINPNNKAERLIAIRQVKNDEKETKRRYFFMLHELPEQFNGEPVIIGSGAPDFKLLQNFLKAFCKESERGYPILKWMNCALDAWLSPDGNFFNARSRGKLITKNENEEINEKIDPKIVTQLIGHVSEVLDNLYKGARDLSFLNQDDKNPRPNIFFALKTAGREEPRFNIETKHVPYRKRGYQYDIRIIIPDTQKIDWLSFEDGVNEEGQTKRLVNNNDLELISRKFVNERSVLDEPLSSGILTLPQIGIESSKFQNPDPEMSEAENKQKQKRHKITTKIFKHIVGIETDDTKTEIRLNAYPIHLFGSPYLIVGTFTMVDPTEKSFDVEAWTHNFHYYSEYIRVAFSRKFRSRLRRKLLDVIYGKTEETFDLYEVKNDQAEAMSKIAEMNNFFFHMALIFPIAHFEISPIFPENLDNFKEKWGDGNLGGYRGVQLYLTAKENNYFIRNMKRPQSNYFERVAEQVIRGIQDRRQKYADAYESPEENARARKLFGNTPESAEIFADDQIIIFDTETKNPDEQLSIHFIEAYIQALHEKIHKTFPLSSYYFSGDTVNDNLKLQNLFPFLFHEGKKIHMFQHAKSTKENLKINDNVGAYIIYFNDNVGDDVYENIKEVIASQVAGYYIFCGPSCSIKLGAEGRGVKLSEVK